MNMELIVGSFAGKEVISILTFCCDARDKVISNPTWKKIIFRNMFQSKSFLMRYANYKELPRELCGPFNRCLSNKKVSKEYYLLILFILICLIKASFQAAKGYWK